MSVDPPERAASAAPGLRHAPLVLQDLDRDNVANGVVCFVLALTGPLAVLTAVARQAGWSDAQFNSFVFAGYGLGGLLTVVLSLATRKPYAVLWTIPGATILGPALGHVTYPEAVGAFMVSGLLAIGLALTGWIARAMRLLPVPIVMGMLAGVFLPYGMALGPAGVADPWLAAATVLPFLAASASQRVRRWLPPLLAGLLGGAAWCVLVGAFQPAAPLALAIARPELVLPVFTPRGLLELVLPVTVTVIAIHNAQGFVVLRRRGHDPAVTRLTLACGGGSMVFALLGCVPACMASLVCAIATASGERSRQYVGAAVFGLLAFLLGLFAPVATALALALPAGFAVLLAALAMLKILEDAFTAAFEQRCRLGAVVALLVTLAPIAPLGIGSALWGLLAGCATSWLLERDDVLALARSPAP